MSVIWTIEGAIFRGFEGPRSRPMFPPLASLPTRGRAGQSRAAPVGDLAAGSRQNWVWMDIGERVGHRLVLATTRVGKTRPAELLTDFPPAESAKPLAITGLDGNFGFQAGGYMLTCNKPSISSCSGVGVLF